jgi:elongation factor G
MGELHLEINTKRIDTEFHVPIRCGEPRVAYRETVNREVATTATFSKVLGETPLYAKVSLTLRPKEAGDPPFVTTSTIRDPAIPKQLIKVALEALSDGIKTGGQSGYPLIYVAAELNELGIQADQTTDGAILGAVLMALNQAINEAGTQILEPIMRLEVTTPEANLGDVTGEINKRHGLIHQVEDLLDLKRVHCEVPLAAMFGFSKSLPKLTGGRGSCSMEPCGYRPQAAPPA